MCYQVHLLDIRDDEALNSHGRSGRMVEICRGLQIMCCICSFLFLTFSVHACLWMVYFVIFLSWGFILRYLCIMFHVEIMKVVNTPSEVTCTFLMMLRETLVLHFTITLMF